MSNVVYMPASHGRSIINHNPSVATNIIHYKDQATDTISRSHIMMPRKYDDENDGGRMIMRFICSGDVVAEKKLDQFYFLGVLILMQGLPISSGPKEKCVSRNCVEGMLESPANFRK
jgi:hypothetical protein